MNFPNYNPWGPRLPAPPLDIPRSRTPIDLRNLPKPVQQLGYRERLLNEYEKDQAYAFFKNTVPYERVYINNLLSVHPNLSPAPFTTPSNINPLTIATLGVTTLGGAWEGGTIGAGIGVAGGPVGVAAGAIVGGAIGAIGGALAGFGGVGLTAFDVGHLSFKINWYDSVVTQGATSEESWRETLIHEMTHVWQGANSIWAWGYVCNSMWHQGKAKLGGGDRGGAYALPAMGSIDGKPTVAFASLNVEQQANLIQAAYNRPSNNLYWYYVENHIQKIKP